MQELLSAAGRAFLRAFAAALLVYMVGLGDALDTAAPDYGALRGLAVAALLGSLVAGIRSVVEFLPMLSLGVRFGVYGAWADSFLQGFAASLIATLPGVLDAPNLGAAQALVVSSLTGAVLAGVRALQGTLTPNEPPYPGFGFTSPPRRP